MPQPLSPTAATLPPWEQALRLVLIAACCGWLLTGWGADTGGWLLVCAGLVYFARSVWRDWKRGLLNKTLSQIHAARPRADRLDLVATVLVLWVQLRVTGVL